MVEYAAVELGMHCVREVGRETPAGSIYISIVSSTNISLSTLPVAS
jgi:hypothetical protein